ncbi:hypothetical protein ACOSQ3_004354 [Xanthoceras sorbifolium]
MEDFSLKFLFSAWVLFSYRHTRIQPRRWVAWGVNPTGKGMVGSQAFVAYQNPAGILCVYTSPVTSYNTWLEEGVLSFEAAKISAEFTNNKEVIMYAKFVLPMNVTAVNHVWEDGPVNEEYSFGRHAMNADNLRSMGVHGGINIFGWGILLPIGVLIARYSKDCAYWVGPVGAAIGFYLGAKSHGIQYDAHKYIGIILVILGFLQVLAVNNLRKHWKIYHFGVGYLVIILSVTNIFKGFFILKAMKIWMLTYIVTTRALGRGRVVNKINNFTYIAFFIFIFIIFILSSNPVFRCKKVTSGASV